MTNIAEKTPEKTAEQTPEQTGVQAAPGGTPVVEPSRRPDRRRRVLLVAVAALTMLGLAALLFGGVLLTPRPPLNRSRP